MSAQDTGSHSYLFNMAAERQCRVLVVLVAVEWFPVVVYSGLGVETRGLFGMATEQTDQMFGQLQQLSPQLVNRQHIFRQSLEMQRQQSQAQVETLTILALRKWPRRRTMPAIFRRKRFPRLKGFKGDERAWSDWRYMFRVEASRCFRQAGAILDWAEDGYDQPVSESDIQQVAARESWADMANFNVQLHGDLLSLMEECTEGFEVVRNTKTEVGLDGW